MFDKLLSIFMIIFSSFSNCVSNSLTIDNRKVENDTYYLVSGNQINNSFVAADSITLNDYVVTQKSYYSSSILNFDDTLTRRFMLGQFSGVYMFSNTFDIRVYLAKTYTSYYSSVAYCFYLSEIDSTIFIPLTFYNQDVYTQSNNVAVVFNEIISDFNTTDFSNITIIPFLQMTLINRSRVATMGIIHTFYGNVDTTASYNAGYEKGFQVAADQYQNQVDYLSNLVNIYEEEGDTFGALIWKIFDSPFRVFGNMLNFDFLGVNLAGFIFSLLTVLLLFFVIKVVF